MKFMVRLVLLDSYLSKYYNYDMIILILLEVYLVLRELWDGGSPVSRGLVYISNHFVPELRIPIWHRPNWKYLKDPPKLKYEGPYLSK